MSSRSADDYTTAGNASVDRKHSSVEGFSKQLTELRYRLQAMSDRVYAVSVHLIGHPPPQPAEASTGKLVDVSEQSMAEVVSDLTSAVNRLDATIDRLF